MEGNRLIHYLLRRKPVFPVIYVIKGALLIARTEKELERHTGVWTGKTSENCTLIDLTGEDWIFTPSFPALSPMSGRKRWRKKDIIELFNNSRLAQEAKLNYSTKGLSAKKLDRIINDIVDLISSANQQISE